MRRWATSPGIAIAVLGALFVIALVQILPQVDLPYAAFHEDSAPIAVHSRAVSPPLLLATVMFPPPPVHSPMPEHVTQELAPIHAEPNFIPIFHHSIRI